MELVDFRTIDKPVRLLDLPEFNFVEARFFAADPTGFYDGYMTLKPVFVQPLVMLNSTPYAYGETLRFNKNPSLSKFPDIPIPLAGIDVSGSLPCQLFFYTEEIDPVIVNVTVPPITVPTPQVTVNNPLPRRAILRTAGMTKDIPSNVSFASLPFDYFMIEAIVIDSVVNTVDTVKVRFFYNGSYINELTFTSSTPTTPAFPLTKQHSLVVTPAATINGISLSIVEVNFSGIF